MSKYEIIDDDGQVLYLMDESKCNGKHSSWLGHPTSCPAVKFIGTLHEIMKVWNNPYRLVGDDGDEFMS